MLKNIYKKEFTRDFSLIMEEVWFYSLTVGLKKYLNLPKVPKSPLVFYYSRGAIEVWSNEQAINQSLKKIDTYAKNKPGLMLNILADYQKQLIIFTNIFKRPPLKNKQELNKFIRLIFKIITPFTLMYYLAEKNLGPKVIKAHAQALRSQDSFYEDCDNYLRRSLLAIFPSLRGYEAVLTSKEINKIPAAKILKTRYNNFVFIPGIYKKEISLEGFAQKNRHIVFSSPRVKLDQEIIKGQSARGGQVRGKIRIIFNKVQIKNFKTGEILVAPMTTPNYILAIKKAKAIITDEGGLLCHAAIIARELKKPCIIGTKIASQILKDGDLVEVDADKGLVRIIR